MSIRAALTIDVEPPFAKNQILRLLDVLVLFLGLSFYKFFIHFFKGDLMIVYLHPYQLCDTLMSVGAPPMVKAYYGNRVDPLPVFKEFLESIATFFLRSFCLCVRLLRLRSKAFGEFCCCLYRNRGILMNICVVCPYFQSKKYDMKLRTDVLEVSCRLIEGGHKVVVSRPERTALPVMELSKVPKVSKLIEFQPLLHSARACEHS